MASGRTDVIEGMGEPELRGLSSDDSGNALEYERLSMRVPQFEEETMHTLRHACVFLSGIVMLLSGICSTTRAQLARIDSLERVLSHRVLNDADRVSALLDIADFYRGSEPERTLKAAAQALELSKRIPSANGVVRALLLTAYVRRMEGKYDEAIALAEDARRIAADAKNNSLLGRALNTIAGIHYERGEFGRMLPVLERAIDAFTAAGDTVGRRQVEGNMGALYQQRGEYDKALECFQKDLAYHERTGNLRFVASALYNIGLIYGAQERYEKAAEYFLRSKSAGEAAGDMTSVVHALHNLGTQYAYLNRHEEAIRYYEQALALARRLGYSRVIAKTISNLGVQYSENNDLDKAEASLREALAMSQQTGSELDGTNPCISLSVIAAKRADFDGALRWAERALSLAERSGDRTHLRDALYQIAHVSMRRGDAEAAFAYQSRGITVADSLMNAQKMAKITEMTERFEAAQRENTIRLFENRKTIDSLELAQQRDVNIRNALELAKRTQMLALLERDKEIRRLEMYQAEHELAQQRTTSEERERIVSLLSKEKALKEAQLTLERTIRNALIVVVLLAGALGFAVFRRMREKKHIEVLRAEAAEYKARAAEAASIRALAEADRRERDAEQRFTALLIESQERERHRIASELHDSVGQDLIVIKNQIQIALRNNDLPPNVQSIFAGILETATTTLDDVRQISRDLRPHQLDTYGLTETLAASVHRIAEVSHTRFALDLENIDSCFPKEKEIDVYRIVQEALNNVLKHSNATQAGLRVRREVDHVRLNIRDNGRGFDVHSVLEAKGGSSGFGLQNILQRVRMLGGTMNISTAPNDGTSLEILLPAQRSADEIVGTGKTAERNS